ncbi:MAG: choice-of-anchor tandem repeat GloVer-containing protein [bacterium]
MMMTDPKRERPPHFGKRWGLFLWVAVAFAAFYACSSGRSDEDGSVQVLHNFSGQDGATAKGSLTLDPNGTVLYGRTALGGAANNGAVFQLNTDGSAFQVLYSFTPGAANGAGNQPHHDAMLFDSGTLYGAALQGGNTDNSASNGNGVLFSLPAGGGSYSALHAFSGGVGDGSQSHSCFASAGGALYGMTALGGANNEGTIYKMNPNGGGFQVLYSFAKASGSQPHGRLTLSDGGDKLFGITRKGGASDFGVVFSYDLASGHYQVLHSFTGGSQDGATSDHGFLLDVNGVLYGMTTNGGAQDKGVIFQLNADGSGFKLLHSFPDSANDGEEPYGSLTLSGNWLYGMTRKGGTHDEGTVFQIKTDGGGYQRLASFHAKTSGAYPIDNVTVSADGKTLYGLTQAGGQNDPSMVYQYGTVFSLGVSP